MHFKLILMMSSALFLDSEGFIMRNYYKLILIIILGFSLSACIPTKPETTSNSEKEVVGDANPNSDSGEIVYDELDFGAEMSEYLDKVDDTALEGEGGRQVINQMLQSGSVITISVPLTSFPQQKALNAMGSKGLQILSQDYDIWVMHLMNLKSSSNGAEAMCDLMVSEDFFEFQYKNGGKIRSSEKISTTGGQVVKHKIDLSNDKSEVRITGCMIENNDEAWVLEMFFPEDIYDDKYTTESIKILNSFDFSQ